MGRVHLGTRPDSMLPVRDEASPNASGPYSTSFSVVSSAEILSDFRKRRSLALISNVALGGAGRGLGVLTPAPAAAGFSAKPMTVSSETRMSSPAARAFSRHASTLGSLGDHGRNRVGHFASQLIHQRIHARLRD